MIKKLLVPIIILFLSLLIYKIATSESFAIANIACKTQYGPCEKVYEDSLRDFLGANLFLLPADQVKLEFANEKKIKEVFVEKIFPAKLSVYLKLRKPVLALAKPGSPPGFFLVDEEGLVLEYKESSFLPKVFLPGTVRYLVVGERVEGISGLTELLYLSFKISEFEKAEVGDEEVKVFLPQSLVFFPKEKDPRVLAGSLQLILARSRIDGKMPAEIDLRYTNPVLRY